MKWVRLSEVKDYLAFGWHVVVRTQPVPDHRVGWVLIEWRS